jgi:glycosyltransferase involved in cell wall biosynthesis
MSGPGFSVIVPTMNMAQFLPDAIASIRRQGLPVAEILVVDSGSTDGTAAVVAAHVEAGLPIRRIEAGCAGPGQARNIGLAQARGEIIAFLDADDLWPADKLERQYARLEAAPALEMVSGFVRYFDRLDPDTLAPAADSRSETLFHVHLGACLYRRRLFDRIGGFDESLLYSEDVDLLLRIREQAIPFTILRAVTLYYRRHAGSMMVQPNPRKQLDFRRAVALSLGRRRALGLAGDLPAFERFVEPAP